jgi:Mrp family chromosome partitioning ATPase
MARQTRDGTGPGDGAVVGLFESVWRHRFVLVSVVVAAALFGYLLAARQPAVYQASTTLLFADATGSPVNQSALPGQDHDRYLATQATVVTSDPVATAAAGLLRDGTSAQDVAGAVTAVPGTTADTLTITASAPGATRAARLADAAARGYLAVLRDQARAAAAATVIRLQTQYDDAQRQLAGLGSQPRTPGAAALAAALQDQLRDIASQQNRLRAAATNFVPLVQVVHPATPPAAPTSPVPLRDAGLAVLVAVLVGAAAAWAFEARTQRRADVDRFTRLLGADCLGRIPAAAAVPAGDPATGEPVLPGQWHQVASALDVSLREPGSRRVLVTAPGTTGQPGRAVANLARAVAADGRAVIAVDADYRYRELSTVAGAPASPGLTELVAGADLGRAGPDGSPVALLPAGQQVGDVAAFYRAPAFRAALDSLRQRADLVLVAGPPVLDGAEAGVLADVADAVVLVVPESASEGDLRATVAALSWSRAAVVGYVLVRPARGWPARRRSAGDADPTVPLASLPVVPHGATSGNGRLVSGDGARADAAWYGRSPS